MHGKAIVAKLIFILVTSILDCMADQSKKRRLSGRLGAAIGVSAPVTITVSCDALPRLRLCCDGESRPSSAGVSAHVSSRVVFIAGNRVREMIEDSEIFYIRLLLSVQRDFSCVGCVLASWHDTTVHE